MNVRSIECTLFCSHQLGVRCYAHSAQIQSVSIKANINGWNSFIVFGITNLFPNHSGTTFLVLLDTTSHNHYHAA